MILNAFIENFRHKLLKCKMLNKMLLRFFFFWMNILFSQKTITSAQECVLKKFISDFLL